MYQKISIYNFAEENQVPYFKDTTPDWSVRGKYRNNIAPLLEDTFMPVVKENLLGLSRQSFEWNGLIMEKIILQVHLKKIIFMAINFIQKRVERMVF